MVASSISTGFLYGNGVDEMTGQTPVCCTPEYLAVFGIGLDSTLGDGLVQGVLREDQAEQQFHAMFASEYGGAAQLQSMTDDITKFVQGLEGDNINVEDMFRKARKVLADEEEADPAAGGGGNPTPAAGGAEGTGDPNVDKLVALLKNVQRIISMHPQMQAMITNFFGEDAVNGAALGLKNGEAVEGESSTGEPDPTLGLAVIMTQTVVSSYDTGNGSANDNTGLNDANDRNDFGATLQTNERTNLGNQPTVSLGEIFQWSLETNVFMDVMNTAGATNFVDFSNQAFTAMSEGDTATFNQIAASGGVTPEQLQVILSSMMNNHANLMATSQGTVATATKNGAHQFLNNLNEYGGDDRGFQFLHIGNIGAENTDNNDGTPNQDGNDNLGKTRDAVATGGAKAIFTAGDNGNNNNGNINDVATAEIADTFKTAGAGGAAAKNYVAIAATKKPTEIFAGADGDDLKSELLTDLTAKGYGKAVNKEGTTGTMMSGESVVIGGDTYNVTVSDSEDFENEGYDVVIITITDPKTGLVVGSFTAAEDGKSNTLVEFADKNGDGFVDAVDDTNLSKEGFDANGVAQEGAYGDNGNGSFSSTALEGSFLAYNEDVTINDAGTKVATQNERDVVADDPDAPVVNVEEGLITGWGTQVKEKQAIMETLSLADIGLDLGHALPGTTGGTPEPIIPGVNPNPLYSTNNSLELAPVFNFDTSMVEMGGSTTDKEAVVGQNHTGQEIIDRYANSENVPPLGKVKPDDTIMSYVKDGKTYYYSFDTGRTYDESGETVSTTLYGPFGKSGGGQ